MARNTSYSESNEFGNYVEYCIEKRSEGTYKRNRFLLLLICILVALAIIPVVTYSEAGKLFITFVPVWMALCGIAYWFLSRFVNIEYEYRIVQGEFQMDIIYGQRQRKEVMEVRVREMEVIRPFDEAAKAAIADCAQVYDCSVSRKKPTPDVYYFTYQEMGQKKAVIFEATKKTLDIMKFYNAQALVYKDDLRH